MCVCVCVCVSSMYDKYNAQGLEILAFPCNQFAAEEPGTASEIKTFVKARKPYLTQLPSSIAL